LQLAFILKMKHISPTTPSSKAMGAGCILMKTALARPFIHALKKINFRRDMPPRAVSRGRVL
jgi:hypothetical protein